MAKIKQFTLGPEIITEALAKHMGVKNIPTDLKLYGAKAAGETVIVQLQSETFPDINVMFGKLVPTI